MYYQSNNLAILPPFNLLNVQPDGRKEEEKAPHPQASWARVQFLTPHNPFANPLTPRSRQPLAPALHASLGRPSAGSSILTQHSLLPSAPTPQATPVPRNATTSLPLQLICLAPLSPGCCWPPWPTENAARLLRPAEPISSFHGQSQFLCKKGHETHPEGCT